MKGMIFSTNSVRAIMEGRKTQTRRRINPQPGRGVICQCPGGNLFSNFEMYKDMQTKMGWIPIGKPFKPRYQVGEVVYVREAWRPYGEKEVRIEYKSDGAIIEYPGKPVFFFYGCGSSWRSLLPAWAARLFVQITAVRPERLQEISISDCYAEGYTTMSVGPREWYARSWDSINDKGSPFDEHPNRWQMNPWVWVYTFEQVEKP